MVSAARVASMAQQQDQPSTRPTTPIAVPKSIFVISPIGSPGTENYARYLLGLKYIIKKAFHEPDWKVIRADEESAPDSITGKVIERIIQSDIIVADITDHNPNVFYEIAVAHGYHKPIIYLMTAGQHVPFDLGDQRAIMYDLTDPASVDEAIRALGAAAEWLDEHGTEELTNPLSAFERFQTIRAGSSVDDAGAAVADALGELTRQVARLENSFQRKEPFEGRDDGLYSWRGDKGLSARVNTLRGQLSEIDRQLGEVKADLAMDNSATAAERRNGLLKQRRRLADELKRFEDFMRASEQYSA